MRRDAAPLSDGWGPVQILSVHCKEKNKIKKEKKIQIKLQKMSFKLI